MESFILIFLSLIIGVVGTFVVAFHFFAGAIGFLNGAPFLPSRSKQIRTMIGLARIEANTRVLDLGSGSGSLLRAAAQSGAAATGVEINPFLVVYSRLRSRWEGLHTRTTFIKGNIRTYPLRDADVVFCYLLSPLLAEITPRLYAELAPGSKIISNTFPLPGLIPVQEENGVFLYLVS